jgi:hypothetical protein
VGAAEGAACGPHLLALTMDMYISDTVCVAVGSTHSASLPIHTRVRLPLLQSHPCYINICVGRRLEQGY